MSFRDNLQHLRATRHMTQEQLAMLVGVSRQSVTKWEAERAYPEMDKLIKICQIFDCSLDDLVSGDLTSREPEPTQAPVPALADVCGYDEHKRKTALRISLGVAIIILGLAVAVLLDGKTFGTVNPDAAPALSLFAFIAAGLILIIPAAISNSAFAKAHPFIEDFYTSEEREKTRKVFGYELSVGVAVILLSVALGAFGDSNMIGALFFIGVAIGAFLIVHSALMLSRINVEEYNIEALSELTEEEVASIVGEERATKVLAKVRRERKVGSACGIVMMIATIIGLALMFYGTYNPASFWHKFFWMSWMFGGIICGIVGLVANLISSNK